MPVYETRPAEAAVDDFASTMHQLAMTTPGLEAASAVPVLLGALSIVGGSSHATTKKVAAALAKLISESEANLAAARESGGVAQLVSTLRQATQRELWASSAQVLRHMTSNGESCAELIAADGLAPLLKPLTCGDGEVSGWAATTLKQIATTGAEARESIRGVEGAVGALVALLEAAGEAWGTASSAAGETLESLMAEADGEACVVSAIEAAIEGAPEIGASIATACPGLLALLQAIAKERLRLAQGGKTASALQGALGFGRAMQLGKGTLGAAKNKFKAAKDDAEDRKKRPWMYEQNGAASATDRPRSASPQRAPSLRPSSPRPSMHRIPAHLSVSGARGASARELLQAATSPNKHGASSPATEPPNAAPTVADAEEKFGVHLDGLKLAFSQALATARTDAALAAETAAHAADSSVQAALREENRRLTDELQKARGELTEAKGKLDQVRKGMLSSAALIGAVESPDGKDNGKDGGSPGLRRSSLTALAAVSMAKGRGVVGGAAGKETGASKAAARTSPTAATARPASPRRV